MKTLFSLLLGLSVLQAQVKEVKIGTQVWMTKNLNVSTFKNGDPITEAKTAEEWIMAGENKQPAWCYFDNDPTNGTKYGKFYNWYAVIDARGLAPNGYHIPTDTEWTKLIDYLGGKEVAGTKMKSSSGWYQNGNGTNESGFNGLPSGGRSPDGPFAPIGSYGSWWSSSEENASFAWYRGLKYRDGVIVGNSYFKENGLSVRCLRD